MEVKVERTGKTEEINFNGKANELLTLLGINSEEVLVIVNGELIALDHKITDKDKVEILSVISGG